jgi:hypothetical protein
MRGHWEENCPASPHRLLNAYVHKLTQFEPIDVDPALLEQEAKVGSIRIDTFLWDKIKQGASLRWFGETALIAT